MPHNFQQAGRRRQGMPKAPQTSVCKQYFTLFPLGASHNQVSGLKNASGVTMTSKAVTKTIRNARKTYNCCVRQGPKQFVKQLFSISLETNLKYRSPMITASEILTLQWTKRVYLSTGSLLI